MTEVPELIISKYKRKFKNKDKGLNINHTCMNGHSSWECNQGTEQFIFYITIFSDSP